MSTNEQRKAAEHAYITTAFDYAKSPIGSRDWCLFWDGWQAALAAYRATPPQSETAQPAGQPVAITDAKLESVEFAVCLQARLHLPVVKAFLEIVRRETSRAIDPDA